MPSLSFCRTPQTLLKLFPVKWLSPEENACSWPRCGSNEASRWVKKCTEPEQSWEQFPVRVLGKAGDNLFFNMSTVAHPNALLNFTRTDVTLCSSFPPFGSSQLYLLVGSTQYLRQPVFSLPGGEFLFL